MKNTEVDDAMEEISEQDVDSLDIYEDEDITLPKEEEE